MWVGKLVIWQVDGVELELELGNFLPIPNRDFGIGNK